MKTVTTYRNETIIKRERGPRPLRFDYQKLAAIIGGYCNRITGKIETANGKQVHLRADGLLTVTEVKCIMSNLAEPQSLLWRTAPDAALALGKCVLQNFKLVLPLKQAAAIMVAVRQKSI